MRLDEATCRRLVEGAAVARLATTGADQQPHLVPVTFAITGDTVIIGIDQKPKSTTNLRRLRNLAENPRAALLCDHYEDDWTRLWWVRLDGSASVITDGPDRVAPVAALVRKYPQYRDNPPAGPVIMITVDRWTGWSGEPG
ncbi:TIGR03668 family PPOX class F420-dependent oxidoreductase [Microlunatus parietis]|uniref:PPOX class probable F420-dependent enzyme n=1 Tax=Microlunatus parietis TaxID=682979 RepID=A0A7Y9LDC4_9ACTN|nr:TIGR03668 family PPOX class F420-dependent oxidoreductase [Microlunatus parietis]NYE72630.1 PPOX class probable F420-dependent enzyme [Microlunatus parietis]